MLKKFLLLFLVSLPLFVSAQTKIWNPARPSGVADNSSLWDNPANWTPAGVPTSTDSVVIASGTNTCFIDAINLFTPQCRVLVIQSNAAVYNRSSLADIGGPLTIGQDLIIRNGGYYFSEAKIVEIGRDLWIQGGNPGGSFIVRDNTNEIRIGRHFANEGALAKRQITATFMNVRFTSNTNALVWASNTAPLHNRTRNTFESEDISARAGFAYSYLIGTPFTILKTGAFDNILVDKNLATIQNSGIPGGTHPNWTLSTTNVFLPFLSGIVGDGVNDFDGNTIIDPRNALYLVGSGKLEISRGTVIVNNVRNTSIGGRALNIAPVDPNDFRVYDNTTTNPRGRAWIVPAPDINIRGDITISDANFGAPSYNGASLDLFTGTPRDSICLHIGGTLTDNNVQEPSQTVGQRRGFYIGPVDNLFNPAAISAATTNNPIVVFNGTVGQNINGPLSGGIQLRDYNNIPNQGSGIVLPNVYIFKPNGSTVSIGGGSNVRILGDLNIFAGIFSLNGRRLIFGDQSSDEINVLSLGNVANPNPDFSGVFEVAAGSNLVMASSSGATSSGELAFGCILRVRRGGRADFSGTPALPISFDRDSRIGGRTRIAVYSGGFISARFTTFNFLTPNNTGSGNTIGYSITTSTPTDANYPTNPGGAYNEGGLKIYPGAIMVQTSVGGASPAIGDAFSDCVFNSTNGNVNLTIDTDRAVDFGSSTVTTRSFTIYNAEFNGRSDQNRSCISKNNLLPRVVTFVDSKGTIGGIFGEDNDDDAGSSTGAVDARIVWQNAPLARWNGSVSTSWNNWQNWDVPNDSDPARVGDNGGTANNLDRLIPGVSTFTRTNVIIPRSAARNCVQDVNVVIDGSLTINERNTGADKTLTIQSGASRTISITKDAVVNQGGTWNLGDATITLQGGLDASSST
ncbi:MAG TPA: hypothetical protein DCM08_03125, partial [Microscillaceae bacterium]|nr:hypothetical protein [Microscillaceae bacterium]